MNRFINKIFHCDAIRLLRALPSESIDSVISDPMYMVAKHKGKNCTYEWGVEPGQGDADDFWRYHERYHEECLRVLKPGGTLAWAMGCKFRDHFHDWFGGHRVWSFTRFKNRGLNAFGHIWLVQSRERKPIPFPNKDSLIILDTSSPLLKLHPCPKAVEEMAFLVENLTEPNEVILDCFAGIGSTLVAAKQLFRRFTGCDLSRRYCRIARNRLARVHQNEVA
jgi:DNA modification methylase